MSVPSVSPNPLHQAALPAPPPSNTQTAKIEQVCNAFTSTAGAFTQFFKEATPPPARKLGLPNIPIPKKDDLKLDSQSDCLAALEIICSSRQGLLSSLESILTQKNNETLSVSMGELQSAIKQAKELSLLANHCLEQYLWANVSDNVTDKHSKLFAKDGELDRLEAAVIRLLRNKTKYKPSSSEEKPRAADTTGDKISKFAKTHPIAAFGAASALGMYCLGGSYDRAIPVSIGTLGIACALKPKALIKDAREVGSSVLSDVASFALPIATVVAATSYSYGERGWIRTMLATGLLVNTGSLLHNNWANIKKHTDNIPKSLAIGTLNLTRNWLRSGDKLCHLTALAFLLYNSYRDGSNSFAPSNLAWSATTAATAGILHFGVAKTIKLSEQD